MTTAGLRTTSLQSTSVADEVLVNRQGSTCAMQVGQLSAQLQVFQGPDYENASTLLADLNWGDGITGKVWGDVNEGLRGVWRKSGSVGTGSWTRIGPLPGGLSDLGSLVDLINTKANSAEVQELADSLNDKVDLRGLRALPLPTTIQTRPGDAVDYFTTSLTGGDPALLPAVDAAIIRTDDAGRACRLVGDALLAARPMYPIELPRLYLVTFAVQRRVNSPDPDNDAIRCGLAWYDQARTYTTQTVVQDLTGVTTGSGRLLVTAVVSRSAGDTVDIVAPSTARYCRPFVQTYGTLVQSDVEVIRWVDITDAAAYSPDLTVLQGQVSSILSLDLGPRVTVIEAATTAPNTVRYPTAGDLIAADVPVTADTVELLGYYAAGDAGGHIRTRGAFSDPGVLQSLDGAYWRVSDANTKITLDMFGAVGDGEIFDDDAWQLAKTNGQPVYLPAERTYLVSDPSNDLGVRVYGPGQLVSPVTGGRRLRSSFLAETRPVVCGIEYLERAYQFIGTGSLLNIHFFGDSTVAGGFGEIINFSTAFSTALADSGVTLHTVANHAVGGTTWEDIDYAGYLGPSVGLFVIKYGINDASDGLETFVSNMRGKLSSIRAASNGGVGNLSIIIVGPTATSDSANNRDERWMESINLAIRQACRDYKCTFVDGYQLFADMWGASGIWGDDIGGGVSVHLKNYANHRLVGRIVELCFPRTSLATFAVNRYLNYASSSGVSKLATAAPSTYPFGTSIYRATVSNGWPEEGAVITERHADSVAQQRLVVFAAGRTRVLSRTANVSGDTWNRLTSSYENITLVNSWAVYSTTVTPRASLTHGGYVFLEGALAPGVLDAGNLIAGLPAGMRPARELYFPMLLNSGASVPVSINDDGTITLLANVPAGTVWCSISSISFLAA
ncbi:SGNH/GDSL hydrolase family protein [Allorhizobium pseudoryzae]|uniref:SGNH/GDSL hydrolase family protein n=1 Tax=Allorhizobium pseudoryzae TaxID=379684 RepID=UPI003CFBF753